MDDIQWYIESYKSPSKFTKICNLGLWESLVYLVQKFRNKVTKDARSFSLFSRFAKCRLICRGGTSDIDVFGQIFVECEYRCLDHIVDPELIIDCGANIGYSSVYFLSRFPKAQIIAIEPDPENFALLQKNIAPFGTRAVSICSGIWANEVALVISEAVSGDEREWARTVREAREGEKPTMMARDIGSLLSKSSFERISILKVDIEGSEAAVFGSNYEAWLPKVDNLVIELHGKKCAQIFQKTIAAENFEISKCGELVLCERNTFEGGIADGPCPKGCVSESAA